MNGRLVGLAVGLTVGGALVLAGCGDEHGPGQQAARVDTPATAQGAVATPAEAVKPPVMSGTAGGRESGERESMAPGLDLASVDTLVTPGQTVEVVALATPEVDRVALKDDFGESLPLVKDADGRTWRVTYRVPMRPWHERWGVSLTAHTSEGRWRRVWLFLHAPVLDAPGDGMRPDSAAAVHG